jgi:hypothetical protein
MGMLVGVLITKDSRSRGLLLDLRVVAQNRDGHKHFGVLNAAIIAELAYSMSIGSDTMSIRN